MLRTVLFDLQGTLLAPPAAPRSANGCDAWELYTHLYHQGHSLPAPETFARRLKARLAWHQRDAHPAQRGVNIRDVLARELAAMGLDLARINVAECARRYNPELAMGRLVPEARLTLARLRDRGLRLGLVANVVATAESCDATLARLGVVDLFACRVYSSEAGYTKPHPALFRLALEALAASPSEAAFVGDSLAEDVAGAQAVGMKAVLVGDVHRRDDHLTITPDGVVSTLAALPAALDRLFAAAADPRSGPGPAARRHRLEPALTFG